MCGWLLATGWGMGRLAEYSLTAGTHGAGPADWPADSTVARKTGGFVAVVVLHPECPCSRATVEELDSIMAQNARGLQAVACFVQLPGLPPVEDSELWQRARRIGGVRVEKDLRGEEARRFGARTSGEMRLYDEAGQLVFHGGVTAARGHVGDNPGKTAVLNLVGKQVHAEKPIATPVFGCALWDECIAPAS